MAKNQEIIKIQFLSNDKFSEAAADESSRLLLDELSDISGVAVKLSNDAPVPAGAKSASFGVAELIIALIGGGALLPTVLTIAHDWLIRQPNHTTIRVKKGDFEVEWSGTTPPAYIEKSLAELADQEID
jgi:hypothetical protein